MFIFQYWELLPILILWSFDNNLLFMVERSSMFAVLEKWLRQAQSSFSTGSVTFPGLAGATVAGIAEATVFDSQTCSVHQMKRKCLKKDWQSVIQQDNYQSRKKVHYPLITKLLSVSWFLWYSQVPAWNTDKIILFNIRLNRWFFRILPKVT